MRRGMAIGLVLLLILGGIAIGFAAYKAGVSEGLEQTGRAGDAEIGDRDGFFPFGLFLFPLLFFGLIFLIKGLFWAGHGHGPWGHWGGGPPGMEDWHRRQHEAGPQQTGGELGSA